MAQGLHPEQRGGQQQPQPRMQQYSYDSRVVHPYQQQQQQTYGGGPADVMRRQEYSESTASLFSTHEPVAKAEPSSHIENVRRNPSVRTGHQPLAATSIVDLSETTVDPKAKKKGPRVFNTAFGSFTWRDLLKRKWWKYYIIIIVLCVLVGVATIYHDDIIRYLEPWCEKIRDIPAGWMIFVGIMFVISFPPLFGHEVICLLCGLIYGLWWGFAVVSLGTMLGEWGNYLVFKYFCGARAKQMEEKDITFACIARVIREGGFMIAFMARLSAIPGHLTTPAFAATGMSLWLFTITAILTLPKQLMAVYLGTVFGEEKPAGITTEKVVEWSVLGVSFIITIWAAWYIYAKMNKVRPIVLKEMEERKVAAEALATGQVGGLALDQAKPASEFKETFAQSYSRPLSPGVNRTKSFGGPRWPFRPSENPGALEDGTGMPLVNRGVEPAGYGRQSYGQVPHRPNRDSRVPLQQDTSYASSSDEEDDGGFGYADGGEEAIARRARHQSRYNPAQYRASTQRPPAAGVYAPGYPQQGEGGGMDTNLTDKSYEMHHQRRGPAMMPVNPASYAGSPIRTSSNNHSPLMSTPPSFNQSRYPSYPPQESQYPPSAAMPPEYQTPLEEGAANMYQQRPSAQRQQAVMPEPQYYAPQGSRRPDSSSLAYRQSVDPTVYSHHQSQYPQ